MSMPTPVHVVRGWHFDFYQQWTQFFGSCNWYDFEVIRLSFELSPYKNSREFSIFLLGLGFTVTFCDEEPEFAAEAARAMAELRDWNGERVTHPESGERGEGR